MVHAGRSTDETVILFIILKCELNVFGGLIVFKIVSLIECTYDYNSKCLPDRNVFKYDTRKNDIFSSTRFEDIKWSPSAKGNTFRPIG